MKSLVILAALSFAAAPKIEKVDGSSVSIGKSVIVPAGESAREVVVIGGSADIDGAVEHDVVVIGGQARVNGPVGGDVVGMGSVVLGPKAAVRGDVVSLGGGLTADPAAKIGGSRNVITAGNLPFPEGAWISETLLKLRLIPHGSAWAWGLAGLILLGYVLVAAGAPAVVGVAAAALRAQPATALLAGLAVLGLLGPLTLLLVISVAGLFVIPFLMCLAVAGLIIGKTAVYQYVGERFSLSGPAAVLAGGVLLTLPLAVPLLGLFAWGLVTAWACGAAVMAGAALLKAENTKEKPMNAEAAAATLAAPVAPAALKPNLPLATFGQRLGATLLDLLFVAVLAGITPMLVFGIGAWAVYQIALWSWKGSTLGGIVVGIRGVRADGRPMDFTVALVRHLASYFSAAAGLLGFFWAAWDPEGQTWHDKIAGTYVVALPKGEPLV